MHSTSVALMDVEMGEGREEGGAIAVIIYARELISVS